MPIHSSSGVGSAVRRTMKVHVVRRPRSVKSWSGRSTSSIPLYFVSPSHLAIVAQRALSSSILGKSRQFPPTVSLVSISGVEVECELFVRGRRFPVFVGESDEGVFFLLFAPDARPCGWVPPARMEPWCGLSSVSHIVDSVFIL